MTSNLTTIGGDYLGMPLAIDAADHENREYFQYCANGEFRLQHCTACALKRYPPTTACPWCAQVPSTWEAVAPTGSVYTYAEVHHAIQPALKPYLPYTILIVELDTQRGKPGPEDAIRVAGNLANADGSLADAGEVGEVGIGSRVTMVFRSVSPQLALPMWTLDKSPSGEIGTVWRYPDD